MSAVAKLMEHCKKICSVCKKLQKALPDGTGKQHLLALAAVANYIIVNGPVVKTQDAEGVNE